MPSTSQRAPSAVAACETDEGRRAPGDLSLYPEQFPNEKGAIMLTRVEMDNHVTLVEQLAKRWALASLSTPFASTRTTPTLCWRPGQLMLPTSRPSQDSSPHSSIAAWRKLDVPQRRRMGVRRGVPGGLWRPHVPGDVRPLSRLHGGLTASFPEGGRSRHLCGSVSDGLLGCCDADLGRRLRRRRRQLPLVAGADLAGDGTGVVSRRLLSHDQADRQGPAGAPRRCHTVHGRLRASRR